MKILQNEIIFQLMSNKLIEGFKIEIIALKVVELVSGDYVD